MSYTNIVAATDFSECSLVALETALQVASGQEATLHLLHVVEQPPVGAIESLAAVNSGEDMLEEEARAQLEALIPDNLPPDVSMVPAVVRGSAVGAIANYAEEQDADLIVVGTHGRGGMTRLLVGSTAEALIRKSPCQVLVAKAKKHRAVAAG